MRNIKFLGLLFFILVGCQTTSQKRLDRIESVALMFRPQESSISKSCQVKVVLSSPIEEKYRQSFPEEDSISEPKLFSWKVDGTRCKVEQTPPPSHQWQKNNGVVVKAAFCTLLQGFAIESPFRGLSLLPADLKLEGEWLQILGVQSRSPVLEVHEAELKLRVISQKQQLFQAGYLQNSGSVRIQNVSMESQDFHLVLSDFKFQLLNGGDVSAVFPREIQSFSISTKDSAALTPSLYAQVEVTECE